MYIQKKKDNVRRTKASLKKNRRDLNWLQFCFVKQQKQQQLQKTIANAVNKKILLEGKKRKMGEKKGIIKLRKTK